MCRIKRGLMLAERARSRSIGLCKTRSGALVGNPNVTVLKALYSTPLLSLATCMAAWASQNSAFWIKLWGRHMKVFKRGPPSGLAKTDFFLPGSERSSK